MLTLAKEHVTEDAQLELCVSPKEDGFCTTLQWTVTNRGPRRYCGVVRLAASLPAEFSDPWFMIPGCLYGENRRTDQIHGSLYPRYDPAITTPAQMTSSWWDFCADRSSSPLVYAHQGQSCFALASVPHYTLSEGCGSDDLEPQMGVGFGKQALAGFYVRLSVPACEEPFAYNNEPKTAAVIRRVTLPPGGRVLGTLYVYRFTGGRHGYQRILEHFNCLMGESHAAAPAPKLLPLVADAVHGLLCHFHEKNNYFVYTRAFEPVPEQIANAKGVSLEWHQDLTGFVGGLMLCRALHQGAATTGDERARAAAIKVADHICRDGLSPSGLFWADYVPPQIETPNGTFPNPLAKGRGAWGSGWLPEKEWVHSRTISDACNHLAAMILLENKLQPQSPSLPLWKKALNSNIRAALALQLANGSYGQYYHAIKNAVTKAEGCGGLLWIPAFLRARALAPGDKVFQELLLASVRRAAAAYAPYVERETIWGAPEDNDSSTAEDGMNAVMAYSELYEETREPQNLKLAVQAADWMLSFRKTYNQIMPPHSLIGQYRMRSRGGDLASTANNTLHVFEALCTRHLCLLSDWTKNPYYRDRARDHWGFVCQYLCRCDGMYNGFRGAMTEQFYWTDWGSWFNYQPPVYHRQKGHVCAFSNSWCIAMVPLGAAAAASEGWGAEQMNAE